MSLYDMMNPNGGVNIGRVMETSNPDEHLLERILSRANMQIAWKRVKSNKGAPGVDKMTVSDFPEFAQENGERIRAAILDDSYQPKPVLRVEIPKRTGGFRPLGIPSVIDRLIQQSIYQVLLPMFDPEFSDQSYGFRPGRSAHGAVKKATGNGGASRERKYVIF